MLTQDIKKQNILDNSLSRNEKNEKNVNKINNLYILQDNNIFKLKNFIKEQSKTYQDLQNNYDVLLEKQNKMEEYIDSLGVNDNFDGLLGFLKILYENKDSFLNFLSNKNNNILENTDNEYKNLLDINSKLEQTNIGLQSQLSEMSSRLNNLDNNKSEIDTKIKVALEKQDVKFNKKYILLQEEKDKVIEDLKKNINNKLNKTNTKNNSIDKYGEETLFNSITIYENLDKDWKIYAGRFTFEKFERLFKFEQLIKQDKSINQENYDEVIKFLNDKAVLNKNCEIKKLSPYYKRKLNRISYVYDLYKERLINVSINTGFLGNIPDNKYQEWLKMLDEKINKVIEKNNKFNYSYILENKKGFLFKEDNKYYTYNFYEEKKVADIPDGDCCMKCGYTRFTTSGCCIYRDCENRKYGDFEFEEYKKINVKECKSKYNKKYIK